MIVQNISTNGCPQTIVIGRRGTYDTMQIAFDLSYLIESYGSGTAVLAVKRSQDESAYPAVVTQEDSTLLWTVNETDTAYVGSGECQLMWYVEGGLAKTIIYPMVVMRDILSTAEEPPDGYENWIEHLTELGAETQQNAQAAAQSASNAESAKDDAVTAKEAAEEAAETAQEAVAHAPIIQNGYWYIWNDGQYVDTGVRAEGQKGDKGDSGEKGDTGNGIASITKTGTSGLVDTYTVTYTDGTTTTFTVTNGAKGDKGDTGATGNGIASIAKTGTSGNVDTYTITYTNGQTVTFTVTNGAVSSVAGKTGAVVLDSGDIGYDGTETYQSGTAGAALNDLNRQLSDETTGLNTKAPVILETVSGAIASFDDGADSMPIKKLVATIEPVQAGTGDPSPDNVRPISGWTGCNIVGTGKNMLNPQTFAENGRFSYDPETGVFTGSNYPKRLAKLGTFKESTQYTISFKYKGATTSNTFFYVKYTDGTASPERKISSTSYIPIVFVTDAGKTIDSLHIDYGSAIEIDIADFQIEEGTTASAYEPFGTTLPITWQSEAGTIYGGTVTLNEDGSADVVSTYVLLTFDGDESWQNRSSGTSGWYLELQTSYQVNNDASTQYCNKYPIRTIGLNGESATNQGAYVTGNGIARVRYGSEISAADFKAQLALSPLIYCVQNMTSNTYHFADIGSLLTYYGQNNIWIDTGSITECDYPADTKLFLTARDEEITGNIAPIENGTTASKAYAQGEYFWHDTKFCKALTAIASGATFTLGTNYQETTVAAELLAAQN